MGYLDALKEVSSLPHQDATVMDALWDQIHSTLSCSTDFSASALMSTIDFPREAFLGSCHSAKVYRHTHRWTALRPPLSSSIPLLGDASIALRSSTREDWEMALTSSLLSTQISTTSQDSPRSTVSLFTHSSS